MRPLDLLIMVFLWAFTEGLSEANRENLGRGVLLMGFSSALLVLSGALGIAYALALFSVVPLLLRGSIFKESVSGGFLVLVFPASMALTGLFYLAWLYHREPHTLAFVSHVTHSFHLELVPWIPFLLPLLTFIGSSTKDIRSRVLSQKVILMGFLTYLIALALGKDFSLPAILGLTSLGLAFEFLNKSRIKWKYFVIAILFVLSSWILRVRSPITTNISPETWHALHSWITARTSGGIMILSGNHTLLTLGTKSREKLLTPLQTDFQQRIVLGNFLGINRLIVERPVSHRETHRLSRFQEKYYFHPPPGMKLVLDLDPYRIYDRLPEEAGPVLSRGSLSRALESPEAPWSEGFLALLLLVLLILLRVNYGRHQNGVIP